MYIFILFVVFWNVNATSHVLSIPEIDFEDEVSLPLAIGACEGAPKCRMKL